MITSTALALALALQVLTPSPASAQSFAECQAWLCLPGGFPPWECDAAHTAVLRRLAALRPALPSWSSCASAFSWDSAHLGHTDNWHDECPNGGSPDAAGLAATVCSGRDSNGCAFSYSPQKKVRVTVAVDGSTSFTPNNRLTHTVSSAGSRHLGSCPPGIEEDPTNPGQSRPVVGGPPASAAMAGAGAAAGGAGGASGGAAGGFN